MSKMFIWLDQTCHMLQGATLFDGILHVYPDGEWTGRQLHCDIDIPNRDAFQKVGSARDAVLRAIPALERRIELMKNAAPEDGERCRHKIKVLREILASTGKVAYRETFTDYVVEDDDEACEEFGIPDNRQSMQA